MNSRLTTLTAAEVTEAVQAGFVPEPVAQRLAWIPPGGQYSLANGQPMAIGGVTVLWDGVGEAWLAPSEYCFKKPLLLVKTALSVLAGTAKQYNLHRVQCVVRADDRKAQRFALALGFERESTLVKYGPEGHDYFMMIWLPD